MRPVPVAALVLFAGLFPVSAEDSRADLPAPLRLVVMDPLALPLSCTCVPGVGQRRYERLAAHLEAALGTAVEIVFDESLALGLRRLSGPAHLVVGKQAMVTHDAAAGNLAIRRLADLTGPEGTTTVRGVFVVRDDSPVQTLADLAGKTIALGPEVDAEAHRAAREALEKADLSDRVTITVAGAMDSAGLAAADGEVAAAAMAAHVPALMAGCGKIGEGELRVVGETAPVPFVALYATADLPAASDAAIARALPSADAPADLLAALESKSGFVLAADLAEAAEANDDAWTDWRGPRRDGLSPHLPESLPASPEILWTAPLTGPAMAGVTATDRFVLVPDKSEDLVDDLLRCLDAATGAELWRFTYEAPGAMDYSNAPRASAVIAGDLVYFQGAMGDLHCLRLATGELVWKRHLYRDFDATLLTWGASSPPLVAGDRLIVNPGGADASLVALDRHDGAEVWRSPGHAASYSAFLAGEFGGVSQIVGYDTGSLGGWDAESGRRLWTHVPGDGSDFNVTTPVLLPGGRLLLATENNGARLHAFRPDGSLDEAPLARNDALAPDTCTPVVVDGRVFAAAYGALHCLDLENGLETVWTVEDDLFYDHVSLVGGKGRVLVWTMDGTLILLRAAADAYEPLVRWRPFGETKFDTMSLPAVMPGRIYLRSEKALVAVKAG